MQVVLSNSLCAINPGIIRLLVIQQHKNNRLINAPIISNPLQGEGEGGSTGKEGDLKLPLESANPPSDPPRTLGRGGRKIKVLKVL